jgi:hypothetical protein
VKNGGSKEFKRRDAVKGGDVKTSEKARILVAWAVLSAGLLDAGCKSAPELTQASAASMIQANYAQTAPVYATIVIGDLGMRQGIDAKYWQGVKRYPNGYWADFKLTDDGKKLVKLASGGDTIAWRPDGPSDLRYGVTVTTVPTVHLKAQSIGDVEDNGAGKTVSFTEAVDLSSLPAPLQGLAQDSANTLTTHRQANFVLTNGAWTLQSVQ